MSIIEEYKKQKHHVSKLGFCFLNNIKFSNIFLDKFEFNSLKKENVLERDTIEISLENINRTDNIDNFIETINKDIDKFKKNLTDNIEKAKSKFISISEISFYNGKIRLSGKINRVVQKGLIEQFEQSLSNTFISVLYNEVNQNKVFCENVVSCYYSNKKLYINYKNVYFIVELSKHEGNIGNHIRKGLKKKNFKDLLLFFVGIRNGRFNQIIVKTGSIKIEK